MNLEAFCNNVAILSSAPNGIALLRRLILQLAFRGQLLPQDPGDEPASVLLEEIKKTQAKSDNDKKAKIRVHLRAIEDDGTPFTLPSCWRWSRFVDIATIASNLVQPWDYLDYPHVAPDNIEKFTGRLLPCRTVREDKVSSSNHKFFEGQIVYSKIRPNLAKAVIVDFEGLCSADMYPINSHIYPPFLLYYLLSDTFLNMAVKSDTRVAMPKINQEELNRILVPIPPLAEQKRIVAKVKKLMRLCDELEAQQQAKRESRVRLNTALLAPLNNAASLTPEEFEQATTRLTDNFDTLYDSIETVSKLRATILQLAIQGKLVVQDRRDEPAALLVKKIGQQRQKLLTSSELKKVEPQRSSDGMVIPFRVPEGWKWTRLGELSAKLGAGSTPLGGKNVYQDEGVKFLRSQNVWNNGLELNNVAYISETIHKEMSGTNVQDGDILLNITGASIGRSCVVPEHLGDANVSQHVSIIRLVDKRLRFFIHLCIISPYVQDSIMQSQVGISREGLSMRNLKEFLLPIPPLDEQNRIVARVNRLMSLCDELEAKLRQAEADTEKLMNAAVKHVLDSVRNASKTAEEVFA